MLDVYSRLEERTNRTNTSILKKKLSLDFLIKAPTHEVDRGDSFEFEVV